MTYPYWPITYPHWPTYYHYWPQTYWYWPTVADLRGCVGVWDDETDTVTVADTLLTVITVTATGACGDEMNTYDVGDQTRLSVIFANSSGVAVDPTVVTVTIKPALGTAVTYTYGVGVVIVKDSTGNYHSDYTVLTGTGGTVYYKWTATGTAIGMQQGSFAVRSDETA